MKLSFRVKSKVISFFSVFTVINYSYFLFLFFTALEMKTDAAPNNLDIGLIDFLSNAVQSANNAEPSFNQNVENRMDLNSARFTDFGISKGILYTVFLKIITVQPGTGIKQSCLCFFKFRVHDKRSLRSGMLQI